MEMLQPQNFVSEILYLKYILNVYTVSGYDKDTKIKEEFRNFLAQLF